MALDLIGNKGLDVLPPDLGGDGRHTLAPQEGEKSLDAREVALDGAGRAVGGAQRAAEGLRERGKVASGGCRVGDRECHAVLLEATLSRSWSGVLPAAEDASDPDAGKPAE